MKLKHLPASLLMAHRLKGLDSRALNSRGDPALPVIISLTSIPSRLKAVALTVRSLLAQDVAAQKIVLWLHEDLRSQIPPALAALQGDIFSIAYVDLTCPHRKLIHTLAQYPNKVIVTCDDDLMYRPDWLRRLYQDHLRYPQSIIAHECRKIEFESCGTPKPYNQWPVEQGCDLTHPWFMSIGYGGVLYPPGALHEDVQQRELFLALTPRADDLWFKAMSLMQGTEVRRSSAPGLKPVRIWGTQRNSLKRTNVRREGNTEQWRALYAYYNLQRYR
jgi:hypothetical protein